MTRRGALFLLTAAGLLLGAATALFTSIEPYNRFGQLAIVPGKDEVMRPPVTPRTMVAFVFGQSNSASYGSQRFRAASHDVVGFWNGRYFHAEDPLPGASGEGGGFAVAMADRLVAAGAFDRVILISAGIGGTSVLEWTTGGRLNAMLEGRLAEARDAGLTVTHFLWHQGETDNVKGHVAEYDEAMRPIIALTKRYFPRSKFFVAQTSICATGVPAQELRKIGPNLALHRAQLGLTRLPGVFAGPNTDLIGFDDRYDGCHFAGSGQVKHADAWVAAITAQRD